MGEKQRRREQKKVMKNTKCSKVRDKAKYVRTSFKVEVWSGFNFLILW